MNVGKLRLCSVGKLHFGMGESMMKPASALVTGRVRSSIERFNRDERGAMAFFIIFFFIMMLMFGGIAVDVMRFETRRVAMQQTMDRAALAAANLNNTVTATAVVNDYFAKADLGAGLNMVNFTAPTVTPSGDGVTFKKVEVSSKVRSNNFFMHLLNVDYLEGPAATTAEQGISMIEVIMVLDVSGSMNDPMVNGQPKKKIEALREAAQNFVTTLKNKDIKNEVSIGFVPYNAQVNIPAVLRSKYFVTNVATYDGVTGAGFPNANCIEIPNSTYTAMALSTTTQFRMAAVADTETSANTSSNYRDPDDYGVPSNNPLDRICNPTTVNQVFMPSKVGGNINTAISNLQGGGYTSIAIGMRWGTALIDESARPIYTALIASNDMSSSVAGRPVNNNVVTTRKIIVLMTDGEHVATEHVPDAYKTGPSPIWKGADGNYAIRFTNGGAAMTGNTRPSCAGSNTYFVNHLKPSTSTNCDAAAWKSTMTGTPWTGSGTVRQLDWSEVWRFMTISYVARQLYGRSNVTNVTGTAGYNALRDMFVDDYISAGTLNSLLSSNCTAAKTAGVEIYGIAFKAPANGQTQISNCSSNPKSSYYFNVNPTDSSALDDAFQAIANQISDLRLTN